MPRPKQSHNYFVFVFIENYPPICVGQFSAQVPDMAKVSARSHMRENPKYSFLVSLIVGMQVAKAVR